MSDLLDSLTLGWPVALWGLLLLPVLVAAIIRSRYPIGPKRRFWVLLTRVLMATLVVLAIADLRLSWPTDELAVASVIDHSASVTSSDRERIRQLFEEARQADEETNWIATEESETARTDVSTDVAVGVALLPRDRVRRMVVATDGRDHGASLGAAIAAANRAGVEVSIMPLGDAPPMDLLSIRGVQLPRMARAGDRIDVGVEMHASSDANVGLSVAIDGRAVASENALARRGDSSANVQVELPEEEGVHELVVQARANGDVNDANNTWRSLLRISPKPRVRILNDPRNGPPALARVFEEAGMRVETTNITAAPMDLADLDQTSLVVIDEANPNDLTETQQRVLRSWVESEGGGLITVTGTHPMRRSPTVIREIEPISIPRAIPEPRPLELVIVIDRSSSMSGSKIVQARNAGVAAVNALRADARVGVVAFSGAADRVMSPVAMEQRSAVTTFIRGIHASGGTNIAASIQAANRIMSHDPRYIHHVILLSDGVSAPDPAIAAAHALASRGVSISAITLGPRNDLMAQIAAIGRGRYHVTSSAGSLPSLFLREAQYRQPPAHRRGAFSPRMVNQPSFLDGVPFGSMPNLGGHVLAETRNGALPILNGPQSRPVLAHWHRGLGQVASFTSATSGGWANNWRNWEGFRPLWVSLAEGMFRTRPITPPRLIVEEHATLEGVATVTVLSPSIRSEPRPRVRIFRAADGGEGLPLIERGPGVWQSEVLIDEGFLIDAQMPTDDRPTVAVAMDAPYPQEISVFGADMQALSRLAAAGGGDVLEHPSEVLENVEELPVMRSLRLVLLALALFFYLLGLLLLRLVDHSVSATVTRPEKKRRRWSVPHPPSNPRRHRPKKKKEAA